MVVNKTFWFDTMMMWTGFNDTPVIVSLCYRLWKEMSLDPKVNELERSMLATWNYPVDDTYTKVCKQ